MFHLLCRLAGAAVKDAGATTANGGTGFGTTKPSSSDLTPIGCASVTIEAVLRY